MKHQGLHCQVGFHVSPEQDNTDLAPFGSSFAVHWNWAASLDQAIEAARIAVQSAGWSVRDLEYAGEVEPSAFDESDGDLLRGYRESLEGGVSLLLYLSPKYPLYRVVMEAAHGGAGTAAAHFMVSAESLAGENADVFAADFWDEHAVASAIEAAKANLKKAGWQLMRVIGHNPQDPEELSSEMQESADEAEELGCCLTFVHHRSW